MGEIIVRLGIPDVFEVKVELLGQIARLKAVDGDIRKTFERINGYSPIDLCERYETYAQDAAEKYVDKVCWRYLVGLFHLEKYMLCSDYAKMQEDIDGCRTPPFTVENAEAWIAGLKDLIYDNVRTLVKKVFQEITRGTYQTGSSYNAPRKKRNNNGVDKHFILRTGEWNMMFAYWDERPTVTDDLEKVCYLLSGQTLPEKTAKALMKSEKKEEYSNKFFTIRVYRNGNTHYTLSDEIRDKLNRYGPEGAVLGEDIKIKIVERYI